MAQLTYWSLQEYDHVPAVKSGRKALCKQMTALMLSLWRGHRHRALHALSGSDPHTARRCVIQSTTRCDWPGRTLRERR